MKLITFPVGKEEILYTYNNSSSPNRKSKKLRWCIIY